MVQDCGMEVFHKQKTITKCGILQNLIYLQIYIAYYFSFIALITREIISFQHKNIRVRVMTFGLVTKRK